MCRDALAQVAQLPSINVVWQLKICMKREPAYLKFIAKIAGFVRRKRKTRSLEKHETASKAQPFALSFGG
jgi:hypothetical protein